MLGIHITVKIYLRFNSILTISDEFVCGWSKKSIFGGSSGSDEVIKSVQ